MKHNLAVGQVLWFVPSQRGGGGQPREMTVRKIGRKWAAISSRAADEYRISLETLDADGGDYMSPGTCWLSQAEHEASQRASVAWRAFVRDVEYKSTPPMDTITEAARLLDVTLPGVTDA